MLSTLDLGPFSMETWTLFGRGPLVLGLVALTLWARRLFGTRKALLALTGFCAGLSLGTWLLPSVIGAVVGGALAWTLVLRAQGERRSTAFPLALYFLGVVLVGRIGCFLNGCCFGVPSEATMALAYPAHSLAHQTHLLAGWIGEGAGHSLAVHPVQLYEALFLVLLTGAFVLARRWSRNDFAATLLLLAAYFVFRGVTDPLRGMVNTESSLVAVGALTQFQWMMFLAAAGLAGGGLWWARRSPIGETMAEARAQHPVLLWFACALCVSATHTSLPPLLHGCALLALTMSGVYVTWVYVIARRGFRVPLRGAALVSGLVLLTPVALHAWDGEPDDSVRRWVYGVDSASGRLVRMGDQITTPEALAARHDELSGGSGGVGVDPQRPFWQLAAGGSSRGYLKSAQSGSCGGESDVYGHERIGASLAYERPADLHAADLAGHVGQRLELSYTYNQWTMEEEDSYLPDDGRAEGTSQLITLGYWGMLQSKNAGLGVRVTLGLESGTEAPDTFDFLSTNGSIQPAIYGYLGWPDIAMELGLASPFHPTAVHTTWPFLGLRSQGAWGSVRTGVAAIGDAAPLASAEFYLSGEFPISPSMKIGAYMAVGGSAADTHGTTLLLTTSLAP